MTYEKETVELIAQIVKLPTLAERVAARDTILNKLDDHKWDFRDEADFPVTYECGRCGIQFEDWEPEPGYQQPPGMPTDMFCKPCWDELADERWAEEAADRPSGVNLGRKFQEPRQ